MILFEKNNKWWFIFCPSSTWSIDERLQPECIFHPLGELSASSSQKRLKGLAAWWALCFLMSMDQKTLHLSIHAALRERADLCQEDFCPPPPRQVLHSPNKSDVSGCCLFGGPSMSDWWPCSVNNKEVFMLLYYLFQLWAVAQSRGGQGHEITGKKEKYEYMRTKVTKSRLK